MPHTDPEAKKRYMKERYRQNREKLLSEQKNRDAKVCQEKKRKYRREYYAANRERLLAQQRERGRRNYRAKPENYRARNRRSRIASYGLTVEAFEAMLNQQNGSCLICKKVMRTPAIDHCHTTGKVRGLLCRGCNAALGLFQDSPEILMRAVAYLNSSSSGATSTTSSAQSNKP